MKNKILIFLFVLIMCLSGCSQKEISDGIYTVEVTLTGGSGKASIDSATVEIENGEATATIVWSSKYYEYMIVDDTKYMPIQEEGNSTFEIPIIFDEDMEVSASTVAMSEPHLIDYKLRFDSNTLKEE